MKFTSLILLLAFSTHVEAAILFENGGPATGVQNVGPGTGVRGSDVDFEGNQVGGQFTLATAATLQQGRWWGVYELNDSPTPTDPFTVQIFLVTGGTPATTPLVSFSTPTVSRTATTSYGGDFDNYFRIYQYDTTFSSLVLPAGTYLFSVMNDTSATADRDWFWMESAVAGGKAWERSPQNPIWADSVDGGPTGDIPLDSVAFTLTGNPIPEPTTLSLLFAMTAAFSVLGRGTRRFRRAQ